MELSPKDLKSVAALRITAVDDLHDGDVGPSYEAHQAEQADDHVLSKHPCWNSLCVESEDL